MIEGAGVHKPTEAREAEGLLKKIYKLEYDEEHGKRKIAYLLSQLSTETGYQTRRIVREWPLPQAGEINALLNALRERNKTREAKKNASDPMVVAANLFVKVFESESKGAEAASEINEAGVHALKLFIAPLVKKPDAEVEKMAREILKIADHLKLPSPKTAESTECNPQVFLTLKIVQLLRAHKSVK